MPLIFPPSPVGPATRSARAAPSGWSRRCSSDEWRTYASLTEPANRRPFVRTLRSVIDVGGQAVSAHDRLYLTADLPTLIVWGGRDRIIPVDHAFAAHEAVPAAGWWSSSGPGTSPTRGPGRFAEAVTDFVATTEPMHLDERQWRAI